MSEHLPILHSSANPTTNAPNAAEQSNSVFLCYKCWEIYANPEDELDDYTCPECANKLTPEPRKQWMAPLCKAHHTEMSEEARAKMRAGGLRPGPRGAQTPEDKHRISGHARKHGAYAKKHVFPRAAHGRLAACKSCPFASEDVNPQGDGRCQSEKWTLCAATAPEFFAFYAALNGQGAAALAELIGDANAMQLFLLKLSLNDIFQNGITVTEVIEKNFKEGSSTETRIKLNPAVEATSIFVRNLGGTDLNSQQLTPKSTTDKELTADLGEALNRLTGKTISPLAAAASTLALPASNSNSTP